MAGPAFPATWGCRTLAEAGSRWVLTLWSSSALAFGWCSWQGGKVSEPRYCLRDDGLMRLRSWLSEDSWEGEERPSHRGCLGRLGTRPAPDQSMGSGGRPPASTTRIPLSPACCVASWSLSVLSTKWRQPHISFPGQESHACTWRLAQAEASFKGVNSEGLSRLGV